MEMFPGQNDYAILSDQQNRIREEEAMAAEAREHKAKSKEVIDNIIYHYIEDGMSCVELAENFMDDDTKKADVLLYNAMKQLNDAAEKMIARMKELNEEHELEWEF